MNNKLHALMIIDTDIMGARNQTRVASYSLSSKPRNLTSANGHG